MRVEIRHDWTTEEILEIHDQPLLDLIHQAMCVHRETFGDHKVQLCSLLSVKTGGCPEDCGYCPQAARYHTGVEAQKLLPVEEVLAEAKRAKAQGATRFCMGAAWREAKDGRDFEAVLEMVRGVRALGLEACATLGMLTESQARRLAEAGLTAYNHNLDTSPEYYGEIITTRRYEDRLRTLEHVRKAGIHVCCGGIIGMGESPRDRARMLAVLASMDPHPESVPVNALVAVPGTPLEKQAPVDTVEMVRMIATARIVIPRAKVRLSAGRLSMSEEAQLLCFMAGANSIFFGDRLLTTQNPSFDEDKALLEKAGLIPLEPESGPAPTGGEAVAGAEGRPAPRSEV
ncbi:MAG: biotin synthase BioB [Deltaproteobacteria bacterium]|nr:MAG: biotin synthase BioB [Deltaproteobacteria bacterium]